MVGDNQSVIEGPLRPDQIRGKMVAFERKRPQTGFRGSDAIPHFVGNLAETSADASDFLENIGVYQEESVIRPAAAS